MPIRQRFEQVCSAVLGLRRDAVSPRDLARQRLAAILGGAADETEGRTSAREASVAPKPPDPLANEAVWAARATKLSQASHELEADATMPWYERLLKRQEAERKLFDEQERAANGDLGA